MEETTWKSLGTVLEEGFTKQGIRNQPQRLETGFGGLDQLLGGGLAPGLTVLGGGPGLGKSTFALQVAERAAEQGVPVLYFSLEMSGARIAAKAISRRLFLSAEDGHAGTLTADQLTNGAYTRSLSGGQWARIESARQAVAGVERFFVVEQALSAAGIAGTVRAFLAGKPEQRPLVVVDYLQILPSGGEKARNEKQAVEESLQEMVGLAREGLPVLLISSLNRGGYRGAMQLDSFKETSGIEYSADVLLGLQFRACHRRGAWDFDAEKARVPRDVEITVLKQRYGSSGGAVRFHYYAQFDCFVEAEAGRAAVPPAGEEPNSGDSGAVSPAEVAPQEAPVPAELSPHPRQDAFYLNNTRIASELRLGKYPVNEWSPCNVFGPAGTAVTRYRISHRLTGFDCNVADAVYTIYQSGRDGFSLNLLLGTLSGNEKQTLTKNKRAELEDSLARLRQARIEISCTDEMRQRKRIGPNEERELSGPFLAVADDKSGRFRFIEGVAPLPLYAYGELNGQLIRFPRELLQISAKGHRLSDTWPRIGLKRFLIRRLEVLRSTRNTGRHLSTISFGRSGDVMEELGMGGAAWRPREARELMQTALNILDSYRKLGYIDGREAGLDSVRILGAVHDPWAL